MENRLHGDNGEGEGRLSLTHWGGVMAGGVAGETVAWGIELEYVRGRTG